MIVRVLFRKFGLDFFFRLEKKNAMKKNRYNPYQTLMNYKWQIRATCTYKINVLAGKWVFPVFLYIEVQVQILINKTK